MIRKKFATCCLLAVTVLLLCACEKQQEALDIKLEIKNPYSNVVSMEGSPVVDYDIPEVLPNIAVNLCGYSDSEEKVAIVKGSSLPTEYSLVDADSGQVVYRGKIQKVEHQAEPDIYIGIADFSEYTQEGTYYLECAIIGQSLRFKIKTDIYHQFFQEIYECMMEKCQKETLGIREAILLLQSYEWYDELFPDANRDKIPDVLNELGNWIGYKEETGYEESEGTLYAAFLAKYSYLYQKYDHKFATDCLKRSSTVFQEGKADVKNAESFFALTELYRATGLTDYRNQITQYISSFEDNSNYLDDQTYLWAIMTYMVTRQQVNRDLCETFMSDMMVRAEGTSKTYPEMLSIIQTQSEEPSNVISKAMEVSCANFVMYNYQYTQITEDFLHYMMGRNKDAYNFYEKDDSKADYIILVSQLAVHHPKQNQEGNQT